MLYSERGNNLYLILMNNKPVQSALKKMKMSLERGKTFQFACLAWDTELIVLYLFGFPFLSDYNTLYVLRLKSDLSTIKWQIFIFELSFAWQLHFASSLSKIVLLPITISPGIMDFRMESQMFLSLQTSTASQTFCSVSVQSDYTTV